MVPLRTTPSPIGPAPDAAGAPGDRMAAAFAAAERRGLELAFRVRIGALVLVGLFQRFLIPWPQVLYYYILMLGFVITGLLSLVRPKAGGASGPAAWTRWGVPLADMALVTFALIVSNPLGGDDWMTLPLRLRLDNVLYLVLFVALSTLTYSPRQVMWTGIGGAVCWAAATLWIALQPGITFSLGTGRDWPILSAEQRAAAVSNPHGVSGIELSKQVFLLLVISGILAAAVRRSRSLVLRQVRVERERAQLARYFSANLVDELADADRPLGDVRTETVAVMFVDIVGFTALSEVRTPEAVVALLRDFHARMQAVVFTHQGTLDKYLGDGLMATFGTPRPGERDAANALAAARDMADSLQAWNRDRERRGDEAIRIGVGLHWGPVVLGDIGGDNRLEFATIGDTVNVASRLEELSRELDAEIVASAALVAAVEASVPAAEAERLLEGFTRAAPRPVRGRSAAVEIFIRKLSPHSEVARPVEAAGRR